MEIPKFIIVFGTIATVVISTTTIGYFFNIHSSAYMPYLIWAIALSLFYLILPAYPTSVFKFST